MLKSLPNPWPGIGAQDYETHMAHPALRQLQTLSEMVRDQIADHPARSILYLGVSTGNGLEHVPTTTGRIHGIDCNPEFLEVCRKRHATRLPGLELHCLDLNADCLQGIKVELILANLILEFVDTDAFLRQVQAAMQETTVLSVIFQERRGVGMVSDSGVAAVKVLSGFHREIQRETLIVDLASIGCHPIFESSTVLTDGKVFVRMDFTARSTNAHVEIREATLDDAAQIADLLRAQGIFEHIMAEPEAQTTARLTERLERSIPSHDTILVALDQGLVVGYGAVRWMPNLILKRVDGYLSELFLRPEATGKGIGTRLLDRFDEEAHRRGAERLWCINLRDRESYHRSYYRKAGWDERDIAVFMHRYP